MDYSKKSAHEFHIYATHSLTERGRAVRAVHRLENAFQEYKELALRAHEVLLPCNLLAVVGLRCRPQTAFGRIYFLSGRT